MRVAMLHWAFPPTIGGVESHLAALCPALAQRGAAVALLTGSPDGRPEHYASSGVQITRTPWMDLGHLRERDLQGASVEISREIASFLDAWSPDVVHAHNMHYFSPIHLEALARWASAARVPLVLTAHNVWDDDLWRRMCARAEVWNRVIAVSRYIAGELARSGFPPERIRVVHHGIDTGLFHRRTGSEGRAIARRYPELEGRRVIFHPARSGLAKGSLVAVEALSLIRRHEPDVCLVGAGAGSIVDWGNVQGSELEQIRRLVRERGLERHVIIRSFSWTEMADVYQVADVTIYPSIFEEPFGLAVLEAMASGSPVVVSRSGGMPEFVEDGQTGFVVEKGDPVALAERCLQLLRDRPRAQAMSLRARKAVLDRHSLDRVTDRTLRVYESVRAAAPVAP